MHSKVRVCSQFLALLLSAASALTELDHPKTILHIDVDCFYAQVEMIHNPELRDVPLGEFFLVLDVAACVDA